MDTTREHQKLRLAVRIKILSFLIYFCFLISVKFPVFKFIKFIIEHFYLIPENVLTKKKKL